MNNTNQNNSTENVGTASAQKKIAIISVKFEKDRLIITKTTDPEKIRQIAKNPMPGQKMVKFRSVKQRGVTYKINSHFTAETTITERVGNILSDNVSTSDYYRTNGE